MKTLQQFLDDLGKRESSGNYKIVNKFGYLGKYQMGEMALVDLGYYTKSNKIYNNDWSGIFTGKDNIFSKKDFLNASEVQEKCQIEFMKLQWRYIKNLELNIYVDKIINNIKISQSGLLAASHLVGVYNVKKYLNSDGKQIQKDGFKTSIEEYLIKFKDYDVTTICN